MLTAYIEAAMRLATYEILPDGEGYYGHVPELRGVWANEPTLEACREELRSALEDWILIGLHMGDPIPVLTDEQGRPIDLNVGAKKAA